MPLLSGELLPSHAPEALVCLFLCALENSSGYGVTYLLRMSLGYLTNDICLLLSWTKQWRNGEKRLNEKGPFELSSCVPGV